jgi:hypothetical protein
MDIFEALQPSAAPPHGEKSDSDAGIIDTAPDADRSLVCWSYVE